MNQNLSDEHEICERSGAVIRKLSCIERIYNACDQWMPANVAVMLRIRGRLSAEILSHALQKVVEKHPLLSTCITYDSKGWPQFSRMPQMSMPLEMSVRQNDEDWVRQVERDLQLPFESAQGPLFRVRCLQSQDVSDILMTLSHSMADGLSAAYVARDLYRSLETPDHVGATVSESRELDAYVSSALRIRKIDRWRAAVISWISAKAVRLNRCRKKATLETNNLQKGKLFVLPWSLSSSQTSSLRRKCREKKITVHSLLCAAFLLAFAKASAVQQKKRRIGSPSSIRKRLGIGEEIGVFIQLLEANVDCMPERDIWDIARDVRHGFIHDMREEKSLSSFLVTESLTKKLSSHEICALWHNREIKYDLTITNLGALDFHSPAKSLKLEAFYGPLVAGSKKERVLGVVTAAECMRLSYIFWGSEVKVSDANMIIQNAMQHLARAIGWETPEGTEERIQ